MKYHHIHNATDDPLFHPGWIEFNEAQWGLRAQQLTLEPEKGTGWKLETVVYQNSRGKLVHPPRNPHLPVHFQCSSDKTSAVNIRKRQSIEKLAAFYKKNGLRSNIQLSPVVNDVRPFTWQGMKAVPRYTYHIDIDRFVANSDTNVSNKARQKFFIFGYYEYISSSQTPGASEKRQGYICEVSHDFEAVHDCLKEAEFRKDFDHKVNAQEMQWLYNLVGDEGFVAFLCRDSGGNPQGAWVHLYMPQGMAMGWSAGVKTNALKDGVNNLLGEFALNFFHKKGCTIFDFCGANIPTVAKMKELWGGDLVCYYSISECNLRYLAKEVYFTVKDLLKR